MKKDVITLSKQADGNYALVLPEEPETAEMAASGMAGTLDRFAGSEVMGIPIGGAALGVGLSSIINALVLRFVPSQAGFLTGTIGKLVLAWVAKRYLSGSLGDKTTDAVAFVLSVSAVQGYVNQLLARFMGGVSGNTAASTGTVGVEAELAAMGL